METRSILGPDKIIGVSVQTLIYAPDSNRLNVAQFWSTSGGASIPRNLGVWHCFLDIYTCTEIGYSKNYAEYYKTVAKRIGVSCEELIMVEDSLHSMVTAKRAGLTVIGVYHHLPVPWRIK